MTPTTTRRLRNFAAARMAPEGALGLHLTLGLAVMLLAAWLFGVLAEEVVSGARITRWDAALATWLHAHGRPGLTLVMLAITNWHTQAGLLIMAGLLGFWLYRRGEKYWLLALTLTVPGALLLNALMKLAFHRARPVFAVPLVTLDTYSFPSGHAAGATVLYGFLACWLIRRGATPAQRGAIGATACAMVALVAFSRLYLGAHYLSDVLAGMAEGAAWLAICITGVSTLRRRHAARGHTLWSSS